jgi:hypothetical protein
MYLSVWSASKLLPAWATLAATYGMLSRSDFRHTPRCLEPVEQPLGSPLAPVNTEWLGPFSRLLDTNFGGHKRKQLAIGGRSFSNLGMAGEAKLSFSRVTVEFCCYPA